MEESEVILKTLPTYFICLCGIIFHVLLLVAFIKDPLKCFRNSATYLVVNLAVCDLTVCLCIPNMLRTGQRHWIVNIIWQMAAGGSMVTIFSIGVDRYFMVAFPFKHRSFMRGKKIILLITTIWIISSFGLVNNLLISYSIADIFSVDSINVYIGISLTFGTCLLYTATSLSLRKQARQLAVHATLESGSNRTQEIRRLKEKRFLTTILLVACVEVIGIVPFLVLYEVLKADRPNFREQSPALHDIWHAASFLFSVTFAINPLIYFLRLPNYRKTFFALYLKRRSR